MRNKTASQLMLALGVGLLCGVFALGLLAFLRPGTLAGYSELFPGESGILRIVSYVTAIALLWVMGTVAGKIVSHGLPLARSESE